mmetsp:Transcript_43437/g.120732  ORF Transcript_43437/g.120732 Transcript_43437/m.120732 type:complete len:150 (-) Transcript_43437:143-592(-)
MRTTRATLTGHLGPAGSNYVCSALVVKKSQTQRPADLGGNDPGDLLGIGPACRHVQAGTWWASSNPSSGHQALEALWVGMAKSTVCAVPPNGPPRRGGTLTRLAAQSRHLPRTPEGRLALQRSYLLSSLSVNTKGWKPCQHLGDPAGCV